MDGSQPHGRHHRSASTRSFDQPSRRLKDSCDMCSASKVRCGRQKPVCGRCERLAYPCFYSPARRVGRPQGRSGQSRNSRRDSASGDGANPGTASPPEHFTYPVSPIRRRESDHAPSHSPLEAPSLPALFTCIPPAPVQQQPEAHPEHVSAESSSSPHEGCGSDCVELGMSTQRQLETAYCRLDAASSCGAWTRASIQSAEAALQTAGAAMRRLSMALICPCSERLETGIIVSAACMSILDLYSTVITRSTARPAVSSAPTTNQTSPLMAQPMSSSSLPDALGAELFWDDDLPFNNNNVSLRRDRQKEHHLLLVDVLGELAKLATVVYQFTRRYQAGQGQVDSAASDILPSVAALLKSRLKAVGDDTAAWLQAAPPRRGHGRGHGFGL